MRRIFASAALCSLASVSIAQQSDPVSGRIALGIRSVDVGGADSKYREDLNLDDGARLFDVAFTYAPTDAGDGLLDVLEFSAANLGGDPFETIHLGVRKYGVYKLQLDRRKSDYFYDDVILPSALASASASTSGDHHRFDFERVRDTAKLELDVSARTKLIVDLEHMARSGDSTTTFDISRDEFELERPFDESLDALNIGVQHSWDKLTLSFDEHLRTFNNATDVFLPGASIGENTTDLSELFFFNFDQTYDYTSRGRTWRLLARPSDRLSVKASIFTDDLDLELNAVESSSGIDFTGAPFMTDLLGDTDIDRDIDMLLVNVSFAVNERVALLASVQNRSLDQSGASLLGVEAGAGAWDIDSGGVELGASVVIGANVVASFGVSREDRDAGYAVTAEGDVHGHTESTDRDGYFARFDYRAPGGLRVSLSLEDNSIDDPFTLGSPTDSSRVRVSARYQWESGFGLNASHRRTDLTNDNSGWTGDTADTSLRLTYDRPRLSLSAGYSLIELERDIDQLVTGGSRQDLFTIRYDADATLLDFSARWQLSGRVAIGGIVSDYRNDGSFAVDREDLRAYVDVELRAPYSFRALYRTLDYREDLFDDYDADLLELSLGVRF